MEPRPTRSRLRALLAGLSLATAPACASFRAARLYHRAGAALDAGLPEEAPRDLGAAAALEPGASESQNHPGLAYLALERREEVRRAFERAPELHCDDDDARQNLTVLQQGS